MVKITYDENNIEDRQLVEDYFWFKYYLKVIEFDILRNKDLIRDMKIIAWGPTSERSPSYIEHLETLTMEKFQTFLHLDDLLRFTKIFNKNFGWDNYTLIDGLRIINVYGIKYFKMKFKRRLIEKFGVKDNL
jgi:hypothetical protein